MILLQSRVFHSFALTNNEIGVDVAAYRAALIAEQKEPSASSSTAAVKKA